MANDKSTIWIIGIILAVALLYQYSGLFTLYPTLNWKLESSTCNSLSNPGDSCEYILTLEVPDRTNFTSFYISTNQQANDETSFQNKFITYVYNPITSNYEEISNKLVDISDNGNSGIKYTSAFPGTALYECLDEDNRCPGKRDVWVACENNFGLPYGLTGPEATYYPNPTEPVTYHCINAPDCYTRPNPYGDYNTLKICTLSKKSFDNSYLSNNTIKFKLIMERISGTGDTSPRDYTSTNLVNIDLTIAPEEPEKYYMFADNSCSEVYLLESEVTSNDYLSLAECQTKILNTNNNQTTNNNSQTSTTTPQTTTKNETEKIDDEIDDELEESVLDKYGATGSLIVTFILTIGGWIFLKRR